MTEPERYATPCAALCFSLTPILPTFKPPGALTAAAKAKRIDFRQTLLNLCQREFETACTSVFAEIAVPDNAAKPTNSLSGSLQFLACLYLHHLLTDRIMLSCLVTVASGSLGGGGCGEGGGGERLLMSGSNVPQRIECLVRALLVVGRQLDECLSEQYHPVLDGLYDQLSAHKARAVPELAPDVQASLAQLLELRAGLWANGGGLSLGPGAVAAAPTRANGYGASGSRANCCTASASAPAAAASSKPAKGIGVTTIYRSSGRLVVAGPGSGAAAVHSATARSSSPAAARVSAPAGSEAGGSSSTASALLMRRQQLGSSSSLMSRTASQNQNLEGLWDLSPDTYSDVRTQLLSQPVENSPATLEAMADELVESAIAASGGDANCPCWGPPTQPELLPLAPATTAGPVADAGPVPLPAVVAASPQLSDEEWAELVQQQWEAQFGACDIYVRLCVDALQQMGAATPLPASTLPAAAAAAAGGSARTSGSGCNGSMESIGAGGSAAAALATPNGAATEPAAAATAAVVGDTGRAFRRLLLSSTQTHFERCLAALLPVPPSPTPDLPSPCTQPHQPAPGAAATPAEAVGRESAAAALRRAWADMPVAVPNAAAALPRARGVCHLLLGLLRYGILTPRIVLHCAAALVDGAASGSMACLQCACILMAGAGKQSRIFKVAEVAAFESLVKRLQSLEESEKAASSSNDNSNGGDGGTVSSSGASATDDASVRELRRRFVSWLDTGLRDR